MKILRVARVLGPCALLAVGLTRNTEAGMSAAPASYDVAVTFNAPNYNPTPLHVVVGDTVRWTFNDGGTAHSATSNAADGNTTDPWDSGELSSGSFSKVFTVPGVYHYHCTVHASMHGEIDVALTSPPTSTATVSPPPSPSSTPTPGTAVASNILVVTARGKVRVARDSTLVVTVREQSRASRLREAASGPVRGAQVVVDGRKVGIPRLVKKKTDGKGRATFVRLRPTRTGRLVVSVTMTDFDPVRHTVKVNR